MISTFPSTRRGVRPKLPLRDIDSSDSVRTATSNSATCSGMVLKLTIFTLTGVRVVVKGCALPSLNVTLPFSRRISSIVISKGIPPLSSIFSSGEVRFVSGVVIISDMGKISLLLKRSSLSSGFFKVRLAMQISFSRRFESAMVMAIWGSRI